ncbi:uncharacterized protein LOC144001461 isoform X4 [Festucalex cinctus]
MRACVVVLLLAMALAVVPARHIYANKRRTKVFFENEYVNPGRGRRNPDTIWGNGHGKKHRHEDDEEGSAHFGSGNREEDELFFDQEGSGNREENELFIDQEGSGNRGEDGLFFDQEDEEEEEFDHGSGDGV